EGAGELAFDIAGIDCAAEQGAAAEGDVEIGVGFENLLADVVEGAGAFGDAPVGFFARDSAYGVEDDRQCEEEEENAAQSGCATRGGKGRGHAPFTRRTMRLAKSPTFLVASTSPTRKRMLKAFSTASERLIWIRESHSSTSAAESSGV